jgi:uncharacterized repeat protein (TIGR03806 family)
MKKNYAFVALTIISLAFVIFSCSTSEDDSYTPIAPVTGVNVDLTQVPYQKLSDYKFFTGELKNLEPTEGVLPFEPASALFSDYAHKKRFVWMPNGTKATYNGDNKILELPVGAVLIKNFYYENVQNPGFEGGTRILETRLMIRKADGWMFANYIWNDEQTEAFYNMVGDYVDIAWQDENGVLKGTEYRIPSDVQCMVCHKSARLEGSTLITTYIPIGIKPQNLNWDYNYGSTVKNQLSMWIEKGYLESNFSLPTPENTTVDYNDVTKPIADRARSYVDINCSHCHSIERHCTYRPMRFAYSETKNNNTAMGMCVNTADMQGFPTTLNKIITPRNINKSMLYYRLNTTDEAVRMPLHGRTMLHTEGLQVMKDWINSVEECD